MRYLLAINNAAASSPDEATLEMNPPFAEGFPDNSLNRCIIIDN